MTNTRHFIQQTLKLANYPAYKPSPNPRVACLIVKNNKVIGQGAHKKVGQAHAEILALNDVKGSTEGADLYVNLEPCCHYGKTPPCTKAIIAAGIKRVFIATVDPNPKVNGRGIKELMKAGIEVYVGFHKELATAINRYYFHYIKTGTPFVIAKWAMSLDGEMEAAPNDNSQITDLESIKNNHRLRSQVDAILVGANTANTDNPQLTTRYIKKEFIRHPIKIILSANGSIKHNLIVLSQKTPGKTIVVTTLQSSKSWRKEIQQYAEVMVLPIKDGGVDLLILLKELGRLGVASLLVEGGKCVLNQFLSQKLVNEIQAYISPCIISNLKNKYFIEKITTSSLDGDILFQGLIGEKS